MLRPLGFYEAVFIASAVLFNLLIAGIFIADRRGSQKGVQLLGLAWLLLAIPLGIVFAHDVITSAPGWVLAAFGLVFVYMLVELLMDYVLHYDFRKRWLTHIPYILLEYAALISLIGIAYWIDQRWSWVVGASFWILLGSLIYLYAGRRKTGKTSGTLQSS